jgi:Putative binding domain, N-terminal/Repeat of unknown function (DUF5648)
MTTTRQKLLQVIFASCFLMLLFVSKSLHAQVSATVCTANSSATSAVTDVNFTLTASCNRTTNIQWYFYGSSITNVISSGTSSNFYFQSNNPAGTYQFELRYSNGATTVSAYTSVTHVLKATPGVCGSSSGTVQGVKPTTNLCSQGSASSVTGTGPWNWVCYGSNQTTFASCSAPAPVIPPKGIGPAQGTGTALATTFSQTFYNATINGGHYFTTTSQAEANSLINGGDGGNWQLTRRGFRGWLGTEAGKPGNAVPLYRFYIGAINGKNINSHFFTVEKPEYDALRAANPSNTSTGAWKFEAIDSYVIPLNANNTCPANHHRVYRAYNGKNNVDPNHRFTTSYIEQYRLTKLQGYKNEGTAFCSPASDTLSTDIEAYHALDRTSVKSGEQLKMTALFSNNGSGKANGALAKLNLPIEASWTVSCTASEGAICPLGITEPATLRLGVPVPTFPAGGYLTLIATATAPTVIPGKALAMKINNSVTEPVGINEEHVGNDFTNNTELYVYSATGCSYAFNMATASFLASGGAASVRMKTPPDCMWAASSNAAWLSVTPSGTGSSTVSFIAQANTGAARTGTITANGQTFVVNQAAAVASPPLNCVNKLNPVSVPISYNDVNDYRITVSTILSSCDWEAKSNHPWITVVSGVSGSGAGTVKLAFDRNTGTEDRMGTVTVGGKQFNVIQKSAAAADGGDAASSSGGDGGSGDSNGDGGGNSGDGAGDGDRAAPSSSQ